MKKTDKQTNQVTNFVEKYPIATVVCIAGIMTIVSCKICEKVITKGMYTANKKTIDYFMKQMRI